MSLLYISPNNPKITKHRNISLTGTDGFKSTVMQIENAVINNRSGVSKLP